MFNYTDDFIAHFWSKVDRGDEDDCWLWIAGTTDNGRGGPAYGIIGVPPSIAGKANYRRRAHHISYEITIGVIPPELDIDHICRITRCVNPKHLRLTTRGQNMQNRQGATIKSATGIRGVMWDSRRNKWRVEARVDGVLHFGGYFTDVEEAERAAVALRLQLMTHNELDRRLLDDGSIIGG